MNTKILFIRHGQTNWNLQKRVQGRTNIKLNEVGIYQAYMGAYKFFNHDFDLIFTSPLTRAKTTANIYNQVTRKNLPILISDLLIERNFGALEKQIYNINSFSKDDNYFIKNIENFESNEKIQERALLFLNKLKRDFPSKYIVCFTHSHFIKAVLEISIQDNLSYHSVINNCNGVLVTFIGDKVNVEAFNI